MVNLPGIPPEAISYIRGAKTAAMRSQIKVVTPAVPVYDGVTGMATGATAPTPGYTGPADVHDAQGGGEQEFADGLMEVNSIQVSVPFTATPVPKVEDHVVILATDDPSLVGETLRIVGVTNGGLAPVVRTLTCTFEQANPFNPGA